MSLFTDRERFKKLCRIFITEKITPTFCSEKVTKMKPPKCLVI